MPESAEPYQGQPSTKHLLFLNLRRLPKVFRRFRQLHLQDLYLLLKLLLLHQVQS